MRFLLLPFVILPIIEMWLLIKVGGVIGAGNTILLVLLTAVIGALLLRQQGLSTLFRVNQRLNAGELPANEIFEGLFLAVGGALLLTPGFVTDFFGFLCLIPATRRILARRILANSQWVMTSQQSVHRSAFKDRSGHSHDTIDGEYTRED